MNNSSQNPKDPGLNKWRMVNLAMEMGFIIALPIVLLGFLGKWLDTKYGTEPWITLGAIAIAILTTSVWLTRRIKELIK
jgi:hypothetical protein